MPVLSSFKQSVKKHRYFFIVAVALLLVGLYIILWQSFNVNNIIVEFTDKPTVSNFHIRGLTSLYNEKIYLLSDQKVKKILYTQNSYIKSVKVRKEYPTTLKLMVTLFKPAANLEVGNGYFILSPAGRILEKSKSVSKSLPLIHFYQKIQYSAYQAGDSLDFKDILSALNISQKVKDFGIIIDSIDIDGFSMIALNTTSSKIIFTNEKDMNVQLYSLEKVIQQFKVQGKTYKTIDLRFDKVVVEGLS